MRGVTCITATGEALREVLKSLPASLFSSLVARSTGGTVRVYNSSANVSYTIAALTGLGQPKGIAVDPTGTLVYVADSWTTAPSRLIQYNRSGQGNVSLVAAGSLPSPVCAKLDPSGSVWVADSTANAAYRFSTSKFNTTTAAVTGIGQPRDMQARG